MGREIRRARYLSEIRSVRELKEARVELELREWFARERLEADVYDTFTLDNLVSIVAPPGSWLYRVIGGVGTGLATVQGVVGMLGSFIGGRTAYSQPAVHKRPAASHAAHPAAHPAAKHPTSHAATSHVAAHKVSHPAARSTARKRTHEIEVEVELEPKKVVRTVRKKS
jgi:hypothetical protein